MRLIQKFIVSGAFLFVGLEFYCLLPKIKVVLFDKEAIQAQLIHQLAEHQANDTQVSYTTRQFKNTLQTLLTQYAEQHHAMILDRRHVLAGGNDITEEIANELSRKMRKIS